MDDLPASDNLQIETAPQGLQRVPSGVKGLDTILHGGFLRGSIYLIAGEPGTGKTILSNQIAFKHVAAGGNAVFISVLTETHSSLFAHLSSLSFFNREPIGNSLYYVGGYGVAQKEGLQGLLRLLQGVIRDRGATLMIIDGVLNAEAVAPSNLAFREFIHQLQIFAEFTGCTVLLLTSRGEAGASTDQIAVQTAVDGLIQLRRTRAGMRLVREMEVLKFRGGSFMEGGHFLQITKEGLQVYPRTEVLLAPSAGANREQIVTRERLQFGVQRLDEMLNGGLLVSSSTALLGPPGSGKTILGLHFLAEGARNGEAGLYFGLNEPPPTLVDAGDQIGLEFSRLVGSGQVHMRWYPAIEELPDVLAEHLLAVVQEHGVKRLFIDGMDAFDDLDAHRERMAMFLRALGNELHSRGITTLFSVELKSLFGPNVDIPVHGVSAVFENIIFLRYVELRSQLYRLISVLKSRRTGHDPAIREFRISEKGIEVADTFESAEAILTGVARPLRDTASGA